MLRRALLPALVAGLSAASPVSAEPIGTAVRVVNRVTAEAGQAARALSMGDGVSQNEVIAVGSDSLGELRLNDETKLALGPGARLKLDRFVYDPGKGSGTIAVDLTKGAFRFITGVARKPSYLIRSPNASISVRGTVFDVFVDGGGTLWLLLHEGAVEVCNSRGECRFLDDPCEMVRVGPRGALSDAAGWNRQRDVSEISFDAAFPFVGSPPQVDPTPRHTRALVETGTCPGAGETPKQMPPTRRADVPVPSPGGGAALRGPFSEAEHREDSHYESRVEPEGYDLEGRRSAPAGEEGRRERAQGHEASRNAETPASEGYASEGPSVPPPVTAFMPPTRWSGIYFGFNAGASVGTETVDVGCNDPGRYFDPYTSDCSYTRERGYLASGFDVDDIGPSGGIGIGANFQVGQIVFGVEADHTRTSASGNAEKHATGYATPYDGITEVRHELQWLGTLRGRLGLAVGNALVFATGGLAYGEVDLLYDLRFPASRNHAKAQSRELRTGWTAGIGAELGFGPVSIKGEYMMFDLGADTLEAIYVRSAGGPTSARIEPEFETRGHIARLGLNFHLD